MNGNLAVYAEGLRKHYRDTVAVDGISFEIGCNESMAILGPNGAGKTTTAKMIYCAIPPTSGTLLVQNLDVRTHDLEIKHQLGVVPQDNNYDPDLTVIDNLLVYASYFDIKHKDAVKRANDLLDFFDLTDKCNARVDHLSGGMKRRLIIARSLINEPQILILDEPTTGLDPQVRHNIWQKVRELKKQGVTIILTTHYMDEAQELADRVIIVDYGKILAVGTPYKLIRENVGDEVFELHLSSSEDKDQVRAALAGLGAKFELVSDIFFVYQEDRKAEDVLSTQFLKSLPLDRYVHRAATLEDVFLKLTGRGLRN